MHKHITESSFTPKCLKWPEPDMGDNQIHNFISHISWELTDGRVQVSWPGIWYRTFLLGFYKPDIIKLHWKSSYDVPPRVFAPKEHGNVHKSTDLWFISHPGSHHRIWPRVLRYSEIQISEFSDITWEWEVQKSILLIMPTCILWSDGKSACGNTSTPSLTLPRKPYQMLWYPFIATPESWDTWYWLLMKAAG